eukprot:4740980-Alexandrium_andersonii.AAC.1
MRRGRGFIRLPPLPPPPTPHSYRAPLARRARRVRWRRGFWQSGSSGQSLAPPKTAGWGGPAGVVIE